MRFILLLLSFAISADLSENIDKHKAKYDKLALDMWELAEMGYLETESSKLMRPGYFSARRLIFFGSK